MTWSFGEVVGQGRRTVVYASFPRDGDKRGLSSTVSTSRTRCPVALCLRCEGGGQRMGTTGQGEGEKGRVGRSAGG